MTTACKNRINLQAIRPASHEMVIFQIISVNTEIKPTHRSAAADKIDFTPHKTKLYFFDTEILSIFLLVNVSMIFFLTYYNLIFHLAIFPNFREENFFLHSMEKKGRRKSTFLPYHVKKHHSTLEMDTFKIMLLLSYLASLDNKPRT